jgi:hypothetical protein
MREKNRLLQVQLMLHRVDMDRECRKCDETNTYNLTLALIMLWKLIFGSRDAVLGYFQGQLSNDCERPGVVYRAVVNNSRLHL